MTTPVIVIDIFVGLTLAATVITFFFLYFVQHRYVEREITRPLRTLMLGMIPTAYSIAQIWFVERGFAGAPWTTWTTLGAIGLNLALTLLAWFQLRTLHGHRHLSRLTRALTWALIFGALSFGFQLVTSIADTGLWADVVRATAGTAALAATIFGAYLVRSRYPGTSIEALIIAGAIVAVVLATTFIGRTNEHVESLVIQNQTKIYQELITQQSITHLSSDAFIQGNSKGAEQLRDFIAQFEAPSVRRVKIVLPDGYVVGSDLATSVGTHVDVREDIEQALHGTGTVRYVAESSELDATERSLESALLITMPLRVSSGQGILGVMQLFLDASATDAARLSLQSGAVGFTLLYLITTITFLLAFFLVFRRTVSHPFAELQDELKNARIDDVGTGEKRRLVVREDGAFQKLADDINHLINMYEQRIRDLKQLLERQKWNE